MKLPHFDPGYNVLLQYRKSEVEQERPPPRDQLVTAFKKLTKFKVDTHKPLNPNQAFLLRTVLHYLMVTKPEADAPVDLKMKDFETAMEAALLPPSRGSSEFHLALARLLHEEIVRRRCILLGRDEAKAQVTADEFSKYIKALTQYGCSLEAASRVKEFWQRLKDDGGPSNFKGAGRITTAVLQGLAHEGREEELLEFWQAAEENGSKLIPGVHQVFVTFYAKQDKFEETKQWYHKPIRSGFSPNGETLMELVRLSRQSSQKEKWDEWLVSVFEEVIKDPYAAKMSLDAFLQWSVLALDKGPDAIKKYLHTMASGNFYKRNKKGNYKTEWVKVDATTINRLMEAAMEKGNPYMAERFWQLATDFKVEADVHTYLNQMSYRLDANDIEGAHEIFSKLANGVVEVEFEEDLPVMNKYLRILCAQPEPDVQRILTVTSALEQRHAVLEPETIVALCLVFLNHDKKFDVIDTLSLHSVSISHVERQLIYKAFVDYICAPATMTDRAWDAYSLLRQYFPETSVDDRVRLMDSFFERKKPEMACLVFGHMRAHDDDNMHPTADIYVRCLEGLARCPVPEQRPSDPASSLRMVHNMLKMDTRITMSTRLYNALMLAYAAGGDPVTALDFWEEHITRSVEGPSYNSLAIVFWCCELIPFGDRYARPVWQKMLRMDLEVPQFVFNAYCAAVARSNAGWGRKMDEVFTLIKGTDANLGYGASMMT